MNRPPLVLVHGLWDTPRLFDRLGASLRRACPEIELDCPHLPHRCGQVGLPLLADRLASLIEARFGRERRIDLFGFSMGGLIARLWLQQHGGAERCRRFVCVGSPQRGTLVAQPMPRVCMAGIADMKIGSGLLRRLDAEADRLASVDCLSFYSPTDLMVVPGWRAVLPLGPREALPVLTHRQLMHHPRAIARLTEVLLAP
jgi:triacylglycerol lipase